MPDPIKVPLPLTQYQALFSRPAYDTKNSPEAECQATEERLNTLRRFYTLASDDAPIADVLEQVTSLYSLLIEAVDPLRAVFGDGKLLELESLASDEDTVLRVVVKLLRRTENAGALMRKFKQDWWFKNCSRSEASLVFDYEIGDDF
jgi:hypothetical protein